MLERLREGDRGAHCIGQRELRRNVAFFQAGVGDTRCIEIRCCPVHQSQFVRWKTVQVLQTLPGIGKLFRNLPLWQSVFFDMGNGFDYFEDIRTDDFAYGYGTGLQIVSPAGPIRVDYARRITTDRYDFDYRWHFTILYAF